MRSARFNRRQFLQTTSRTVAATSLTALVRPASADDVSATLDAHTIFRSELEFATHRAQVRRSLSRAIENEQLVLNEE
jgi:hypothetical protein